MASQTPPRLTLPMSDALSQNASLASLLKRVHESNARYLAVRGHLPAGLAAQVQPGPLDETGWTLLVSSGAAAAKLRQCLPKLQQALSSNGWADVAIRVKVMMAAR